MQHKIISKYEFIVKAMADTELWATESIEELIENVEKVMCHFTNASDDSPHSAYMACDKCNSVFLNPLYKKILVDDNLANSDSFSCCCYH